ncbi:NAD-dependent epimerase/dehydratase family protein [Salibacter halophilus]|uniref:NAD-dependent epimerase/dehydratase family protein n=1 Tax=Salibacter halophilus TaxID=1803916 RepID=A0A6N6M1X3_9FLAO|nr:NAD-dependent epimerase/dehydratase family protein [Salibacter halophilus]
MLMPLLRFVLRAKDSQINTLKNQFPDYLCHVIFITGATGLVGSHLAYFLLSRGEKLRALKRESSDTSILENHFKHYGGDSQLLKNIEWVDGDLFDVIELEKLVNGCDEVYHAAAYVSFDPAEKNKLYKVNIEGTANLVNIALDVGVRKFGYVSSTAAIGSGRNGDKTDENIKWKEDKHTSYYAISKHYGEREIWRGSQEGLNVAMVNPCIVVGPGNWNTSSAAMFSQVWDGLKFYTTGSNAFVDVRDVAQALIEVMDEELFGNRYLVVGKNMKYRDYFNLIADALDKKRPSVQATKTMSSIAWRLEKVRSFFTGKKPLITRETAQSANSNVQYSNEKIKKELDFEFNSIEKAVKDTAERFLNEH